VLWSYDNEKLNVIRKYEFRNVDKELDLAELKMSAVYEAEDGDILCGTRGSEII